MKKRKEIVKDRKKTIALLLCVCVCGVWYTGRVQGKKEWVPQNNWSIQGKWKWNNLLVRLVILLYAIAIKTCYKQLKINNTVYLRVLFTLMKATEGSYYFDSWRIQNVSCFVDICSVMLCSCLVKKAIFCFPARSKFLTDLLPIFQQLKTAKKKATEITVCFNWALHFHRLSNEFSW